MSEERTYEIAGTSVKDGELTYRFANGSLARRKATLERGGHEDVVLFELPRAMTQQEAITWLKRSKRVKNAELPVRGRRPAEAANTSRRKAA